MTQYARARSWLASAKDDWLLPLSKGATQELIAEHEALTDELKAARCAALNEGIARDALATTLREMEARCEYLCNAEMHADAGAEFAGLRDLARAALAPEKS